MGFYLGAQSIMTTPPPEADAILNAIRRLVRALHLYSREAETRLGLSGAQLFILQLLADGSPVSLKELAKRAMCDLSSASVVVEKLVRKELLARRRSEKDGRVLEIWLSAQGKLLLRQRPDALQTRLIQALARMKASRRRALSQGLSELLGQAGLQGERPALLFESDDEKRGAQ
jgi:DNA-binding MarR family transcriptional regulator